MKTSIPKLHSIKFKDSNIVLHPSSPPIDSTIEETFMDAYEAGMYEVAIVGYVEDGNMRVYSSSVNKERIAHMLGQAHISFIRD